MLKHNLITEFPQYEQHIQELKISNSHFKKLYDEYHEVDHEINKIESGIENTSDDYLHKLRTHRVYLKDELYKLFTH